MAGALPRHLLPLTAQVADDGRLSVGGVDLLDLVEEHGTPLFVYDEVHLRERCREAVAAFDGRASYASKAFLCKAMAALVHEEGMGIDVSTGGELHVALAAGMPAADIVLHGNNKSTEELRRALEVGVGRIVVDSEHELDRIESLVADGLPAPRVLLRVTPGVEAHTHEYVMTGQDDTKFGFGLASGAAEAALARARASDAVELVGIHAHIGSNIFLLSGFTKALEKLAPLVQSSALAELSIGGGLGVAYVEGEETPTFGEWAGVLQQTARELDITPALHVEPGRSIAAGAAVTLYRVGTIKELPGIRTYVSVDGGMSDNPRPVLYGSGYEAFLPRATDADRPTTATIVGKHCESGDVLVRDAHLPADVAVGDVLATPVTGAYGHSMASNYNKVPRPPVLFVRDGEARVVVRRETEDDLLRLDA
ncbi:MAG TPA: diaminopimelate decarboxylase [Acidimicrobiales bacterium]|nr:diaminopimelate decarboxylase [Acidimicrobiales bacterium]